MPSARRLGCLLLIDQAPPPGACNMILARVVLQMPTRPLRVLTLVNIVLLSNHRHTHPDEVE